MLVKRSGLHNNQDGCNYHKPNCYNRLLQPITRFNSCHRRGYTANIFCNTLAIGKENYNSRFRTELELNGFILSMFHETHIPFINTSQYRYQKISLNYGCTQTNEQTYDCINACNDSPHYYFTLPDVIDNFSTINIHINYNKPINQAHECVDKCQLETVNDITCDKDNIPTACVYKKLFKKENDSTSLSSDCENFSVAESDFLFNNKPNSPNPGDVHKMKHGNLNFINSTSIYDQVINQTLKTDKDNNTPFKKLIIPESDYVNSNKKLIDQEENVDTTKYGNGNFIGGTTNKDQIINQAPKTGKEDNSLFGTFTIPEADYVPYGLKPNNQPHNKSKNKPVNDANNDKSNILILSLENQALKTDNDINLLSSDNFTMPESDTIPVGTNSRPFQNDSESLIPFRKSGKLAITSINTPTNLPLGDEGYVPYIPTHSKNMGIHSAQNKVNAETQSLSGLFNIPPMKSVSTNIVTNYESTSGENATISHQNEKDLNF